MRKITSFLMMVLFSVVAFAQGVRPITSLEELNNESVYTIKSSRTFLLYSEAFPNNLVTGNGRQVGSVDYEPTDTNQHFRIVKEDENFYLFSVGANKYVSQSGSYVATIEEAHVLTITESSHNAEHPWYMQIGDHGMNSQIPNQSNNGIILNTWTLHDDGNVYEIAEIDVTQIDPFETPYKRLYTTYESISGSIDVYALIDGENVGTSYANYKEDIAAYFIQKTEAVEAVILGYATQGGLAFVKSQFATTEDLNNFTAEYSHAYDSLINNTVARAMAEIENGYYVINSAVPFLATKSDTVFHTQESADEYNANEFLEPGMDGYVEAGDVKEIINTYIPTTKAVYAADANAKWADVKEDAAYLFWIERSNNDSVPTYHIINQYDKKSLKPIIQATNATFELCDTAEFVIDWYGVKTLESGEVPQIAIRSLIPGNPNAANLKDGYTTEKSFNYMHLGGHGYNETTQKGNASGNIVGWSGGALVSQFYLTPVDEATVQAWMAKLPSQKEIRAKVDFADSIAAAFPAQLEIAKDSVMAGLATTSADQFYSQYTTNDGQRIPSGKTIYDFLIDGNPNTYWHSRWEDGAVDWGVHYLQVEVAEPLKGEYKVILTRRANTNGDHITQLTVKGYNEEPTNETTFDDGDELGVIELPFTDLGETVVSTGFDATGYKYFRFYSLMTVRKGSANGGGVRGYWHAAEFSLAQNPHMETRYAVSQYQVRKKIADALSAAIEVWNKGAYNRNNTSLLNNKTFIDAYNAIVAAGKAWGSVYVDPTALRNAIDAAPTNLEALFPIGSNPGEWSNHDNINITSAIAEAKAYNESGAYTPAESDAHVKAIAESEINALASANKVQTGVWYRFAFPDESLFDTFGWDKTASKAVKSRIQETADSIEVYRSLWNKYAASGYSTSIYEHESTDGVKDTIRQYIPSIEQIDYKEDMGIFFFTKEELEEAGVTDADLFRFIQATDSTYMIQHKGSGLFLQGAWPCVLSAKPTFFDVKALGAGTNLIGWTDILGNRQNSYLHGQRSDGALVTWSTATLGSNSMMRIEATDEPVIEDELPTLFNKWMWPGRIYTYTYPVDITILNGAKAYSADLIEGESKQNVVLNEITEMPIKAGTPFVLIAEHYEEYISIDEITEQITEQLKQELGVRNLDQIYQQEVINQVNDMYAIVELEHGMEINTFEMTQNDLVGTMAKEMVPAGKAIVAKENGFAHTLTETLIPEFSAYITCDFDAKSPIVQTPIHVTYDNSTEPNPSEPLDNTMFAENTSVLTEGDFVLPILMNNTEPIISYEFEICLPQGFSFKKNTKGEYAISNAYPRVTDHKFVTTLSDNGNLKIAAYSMTNKPIRGYSGTVANITLIADKSLANGDYEISLNNIVMTKADAVSNFEIDRTVSIISILKDILGDINNDGNVNITDITQVIETWIQGLDDEETLAQTDLNNDGKINVTDISAIIKIYLEYSESSLAANDARKNVFKDRDNIMFAEPIKINAGETQEIKINLSNPNVNVVSAEFDLCLPNGFELAKDEHGCPEISLGSRLSEYEILSKENIDGTTKIAFYSMTNSPVIDKEGTILVVKIKATGQVTKGEYELHLTNQLLTNSDIKSVYCASTASAIHVEQETSIGVVGADISKQNIYDLSGRRTKAKKHGVYIVNNKKVVK